MQNHVVGAGIQTSGFNGGRINVNRHNFGRSELGSTYGQNT